MTTSTTTTMRDAVTIMTASTITMTANAAMSTRMGSTTITMASAATTTTTDHSLEYSSSITMDRKVRLSALLAATTLSVFLKLALPF